MTVATTLRETGYTIVPACREEVRAKEDKGQAEG